MAQTVKPLSAVQETRVPGVWKTPWKRQWHPTPVLLPGKSHGWRNLVGIVHGVTKSRTRLSDFTFFLFLSDYLPS